MTTKIKFSKAAIASLRSLMGPYEGDLIALTNDNYGYGVCLLCGEIEEWGVEPDAEGYTCNSCEAPGVMGLENALMYLV
jgi:hypothetical protein